MRCGFPGLSGVGSGQKRPLLALERQTVLVTGAAQGLGAAVARHLHGLGARLILLDRDEEGLAETGATCPGAISAVVDLADAGATERVITDVVTGPVDPLIHNAAVLR
ncbi:MAG: SDR family oxidoreductase, partial [Roseibacillus sp.]|nr:SDR family oxidoreductase [Roseibacillus sp.]